MNELQRGMQSRMCNLEMLYNALKERGVLELVNEANEALFFDLLLEHMGIVSMLTSGEKDG